MLHQNFKQINMSDFFVAEKFPKTPSPKPARIHSTDPFLRAGNSVSVLPNPNPKKNSFGKTESALKPHALPEYLEGRTPKEKHPFLGVFFLSGLLAYSPVRGAFSERTL